MTACRAFYHCSIGSLLVVGFLLAAAPGPSGGPAPVSAQGS